MNKKLIAIILLGISLFVGCAIKKEEASNGESKSEIAQYDSSITNEYGSGDKSIAMDTERSSQLANIVPEENRKMINNAEVQLETTEFDNSIETLKKVVDSFGGYIESSNIYNGGISGDNYKSFRNANYSIRIPNEKFESFIRESSNIAVVINERTFAQDISSQYYDSEARLKVLKAQEERYLSILSNATEVAEVIEVEKALTEVRYEIEMITGYLKNMNNLVDMSTVNMTIYEVAETSKSEKVPVTIGEKITKAFNDSLKSIKTVATGIVLVAVMAIPYLAIVSIISLAIYFIYKKIKINKKPRE